ncbi:Peptidase M19 renal dipeptidase [Neofusicoccum parvum]|uniref:Peptidase M19 renal dipeptidase n=1 Tax=Neofusicoccum parvum TaxID=310453 RepID=A0ACB5SPU8_9PEZI|nr:Peptidase M19 renal dipeptidase [Neofusicoccum parvum]
MLIVRKLYRDYIYAGDFASKFENGGLEYHTDIPRLQKGMSSGSFWVAWVTCPASGTDFSDETYDPVVKATLEQLDLFHRLGDRFPEYFTPTLDSESALRAYNEGRFISPLSIEGLHQIGNSIPTLRTYYDLGVRYATLTWNCHNIYADAALVVDAQSRTVAGSPYWGGLTAAGREIVLEMNRLGMMVDISHVSADTMRDVLGGGGSARSDDDTWTGSLAPPIFSHSSAYSICPHPRNVPDDVLQLVRARRSLVMVNFNPDFISCAAVPDPDTGIPPMYPPNATLAQVVRHVTYIGELIGYDYVGLGSDFDGIAGVPDGLEDVGKFPNLVAALLEEGVSEEDVVKIIGGNLLRVWGEVDRVAAELRKQTPPLEDGVSDFNGTDPT